jgi:hypothetical protein
MVWSEPEGGVMDRVAVYVLAGIVLVGCAASGAQVLEPGSSAGEQGIYGQATIGPMCPVIREGEACPDEPYQAAIVVENGQGRDVGHFQTGSDGRFRVELPPGDYVIVPRPGPGIEFAGQQTVTIGAGQWVEIAITYDSGIR